MGKICKHYSVNRGWTHVRFDGESEMPSYREILSGQGQGEEAWGPRRLPSILRPAPIAHARLISMTTGGPGFD
jgi:hypothetical protein